MTLTPIRRIGSAEKTVKRRRLNYMHRHGSHHREPDKTEREAMRERLRATVPVRLRLVPHWVVWRWIERDEGKPAKVPYQPHTPLGGTPRRAAVNRPADWGTFEQALAMLSRGTFAGVGFVFHEVDPFLGIDLDDCLDAQGQLTDFARTVLLDLESYSEWSPSRGIHILVEATIPTAVKRRSLEMYCTRRFFTVSGLRVEGTPDFIQPHQAQVDALYQRYAHEAQTPSTAAGASLATPGAATHTLKTGDDLSDAELLRRATDLRGRYGAEFARLWRGDKSGCVHPSGEHQGEIDDSLADLVLCGMLAFWTGKNAYRMDHLFRQSGLMRPKWDQRARSGQTYGEGTIALAIARCTRVYDPTWKPSQHQQGSRSSSVRNNTFERGRGRHHGNT